MVHYRPPKGGWGRLGVFGLSVALVSSSHLFLLRTKKKTRRRKRRGLAALPPSPTGQAENGALSLLGSLALSLCSFTYSLTHSALHPPCISHPTLTLTSKGRGVKFVMGAWTMPPKGEK